MAGHVQLKFIMTECPKTQIRMTGLICACECLQEILKYAEQDIVQIILFKVKICLKVDKMKQIVSNFTTF